MAGAVISKPLLTTNLVMFDSAAFRTTLPMVVLDNCAVSQVPKAPLSTSVSAVFSASLAAAPHGALQCATLAAMSGVGGPEVLEALQQQNLIVRRSFHTLARDIHLAAFGARRCDVYMLPSAAHAAVVRDMARAGELQPPSAWRQLRRRA